MCLTLRNRNELIMNKDKIEAILKDQGRSKKWLQERMGMTRTTFYLMLTGKRPSRTHESKEVANLLEVPIDDIV